MSELKVTSAVTAGTHPAVDPARVDKQAGKQVAVPAVEPELSYDEAMQKISEAVELVNEELIKRDKSIRFSVDETLNRPIVSVVDKATGETVRQLPSDEMLHVARNIESLKGILIKEWV